ncbi:hypothetical protein ACIBL3_04560 [Kribbella sp. NPDC050124]|uniref:hypothetical protein n=1 Tax=Kribbella sp. NPDC050124 TaxID=3364114 RepID=UPI003793BDD4
MTVRRWTATAIGITLLAAAACSTEPEAGDAPALQSSTTTMSSTPATETDFKSGTGWDAANRRFTEDCQYKRYDARFDGSFDWSISLARTPFGNASTSETDAF